MRYISGGHIKRVIAFLRSSENKVALEAVAEIARAVYEACKRGTSRQSRSRLVCDRRHAEALNSGRCGQAAAASNLHLTKALFFHGSIFQEGCREWLL